MWGRLFGGGIDPGARVGDALLAAKGLEQIHGPRALRIGAQGQRLPFHCFCVRIFRWKDSVEKRGIILAGLAVRAGDLPGSDEIGSGFNLPFYGP